MINFEIYKSGRIIRYEENTQLFNKEKINTLFIFHGLYGRGKNWQSFAKKISQNTKLITTFLEKHFLQNQTIPLL